MRNGGGRKRDKRRQESGKKWGARRKTGRFPPRRPPPWNSITPCLQLSTLNPLYWIQTVCRCVSEFDQFYGQRVSMILAAHPSIDPRWNYTVIARWPVINCDPCFLTYPRFNPEIAERLVHFSHRHVLTEWTFNWARFEIEKVYLDSGIINWTSFRFLTFLFLVTELGRKLGGTRR